MASNYEIKLPEMGEGITGGDVISVLVAVGDQLEVGQGICELETSKALIEVPSPVAGKVVQVQITEGDQLEVGSALITLSGVGDVIEDEPETQSQNKEIAHNRASGMGGGAGGTGGSGGTVGAGDAAMALGARDAPSQPTRPPQASAEPTLQVVQRPAGAVAPAGPATRRLARELGVDPLQVVGSGPAGRVTKGDIRGFVRSSLAGGGGGSGLIEPALPDCSKYGPIERVKPSKVKALTAEHMALSWAVVPQVTQFEDVDITELEELRKRLDLDVKAQGGRLTLTVIMMKALVTALKSYLMFNASRDPESGETLYKHYYNFGIATATTRGLVVPVIHDVDQKTMLTLALELSSLAARVRDGKVQLGELAGGSFTISNQGGIGGGHFTPIVNHPQSAIIGLGRSRTVAGFAPGSVGREVMPRTILPLAVSYDHRICDGAEAAGFIRLLKESLEDPGKLLLGL